MGRGRGLRIALMRRERQQLDDLLSGGLQPVRTVLRALALRQVDEGQSTPAVGASLGLSAKAVWQIGKRYLAGAVLLVTMNPASPLVREVNGGEFGGGGRRKGGL